MGLTATAVNVYVTWGDPAFLATPTSLLVAWWVKVTSFADSISGPGTFKSDFSTHGWWHSNDASLVALTSYPSTSRTLLSAPVSGQGWIHTGFWTDASTLKGFRNGTPDTDTTPGTGILTHDTASLGIYLGGAGITVAEMSLFSGLSLTTAAAIMTKLSNPAHAQRRAIDISDYAASFYAPLATDVNEIIIPVSGTPLAGYLITTDHPWSLTPPPTPVRSSLSLLGVS